VMEDNHQCRWSFFYCSHVEIGSRAWIRLAIIVYHLAMSGAKQPKSLSAWFKVVCSTPWFQGCRGPWEWMHCFPPLHFLGQVCGMRLARTLGTSIDVEIWYVAIIWHNYWYNYWLFFITKQKIIKLCEWVEI